MSGEPISVPWLLDLYFPQQRPRDHEAALEAIFAFYRCGKAPEKKKTDQSPPYAFGADADALCAAFLQSYGIDLTTAEMHWWRFQALLSGLLEIGFAERVRVRTTTLGKIKDRDMRVRIQRLQELYALDRHGEHQKAPTTLEEYEEMLLQQAKGER